MALIKKIPLGLVILEIPFIWLSYQYATKDSLAVYDASSHLGAVWYLKEYLWPAISGFNSLNLLGFDQGLLYPSLFHYTSATLAFLLEPNMATKLVVAAAILLLPVSSYLLASAFFVSRNARIFVAGMLLVVLFGLPGYLGANFKGLIQVGLLPSFASLPLIFLYLWSLLKSKPSWILSAVLLAAVILTHLVAGLVCLIFAFSVLAIRLKQAKHKNNLLKQLCLAIGLAAFFLVPFVFSYQLLSQSVHLPAMLLPNIAVTLVVVALSYSFLKVKKEQLYPISLASIILTSVVLVDAIILRFGTSTPIFETIYNLHLYRYQIYLYLLVTILVAYWPARFLFEFSRKSLVRPEYTALLPVLVILFAIFLRPPFLVDKTQLNISNRGTQGRFLEIFNREDSYPWIYSTQNQLVMEKNLPWAYGLLTDSTPNGPYLGSLIKSFDTSSANEEEYFVERRKVDRNRQYDLLNLFGIQNLLFLQPGNALAEEGINTLLVKSGVGQNLAEIPNLEIKNIQNDWDQQVESWWLEKGKLDTLLVENAQKTATTSATVENLKHNRDWTKFSFEVESDEKVPVLVKFTHLPGWQASVNQEKIDIHRASPHLMLVYVQGQVEFEYKKLWYQYLGCGISVVSLGVLISLLISKMFRKNAKR